MAGTDSPATQQRETIMHDGDTITHAGLTFRVSIHHDDDHGAPWDESDCHGPVSDWRHSSYSCYPEKAPGERVLASDRGSYRYYNVAEATRIAKRDGWGLGDADMAKLEDKLGRAPTRGEVVAAAVEQDFDYLRRWCSGLWHYVGVIVTLLDTEGDETHESESLWRIDSESLDYIAEVAQELAEELAARIGDDAMLHVRTPARDSYIRIRT